ncbi:AAA family ATPase [Fodinicola feengrottensis]|uniref:AAA family ATPase n=1 Tax=Fodinicola feengrottensis TaxID=435914 RepID=A0ABN2GE49_9ACTN
MLIWLNGTFGAGKTATANELTEVLADCRVYDPELVGALLRHSLGDIPVDDFQDWTPWRPLVAEGAIQLARFTHRPWVVPQTLLREEYYQEIFDRFRSEEVSAFMVLLDAEEEVLRDRIEKSDEFADDPAVSGKVRDWRLAHLRTYAQSRDWMASVADLVIDTSELTAAQAAKTVLAEYLRTA